MEQDVSREAVVEEGVDPEWVADVGYQKRDEAGLLDTLSGLPVFDTLSLEELSKLERIVHRRHFRAGEVVLEAWVPRSGMFVIRSGSAEVVRLQEDGSSAVVGHLAEGELLGEFSLLDDSPRSTSIVAAEPSELIGFFRPDLMDLIQTDPQFGYKILYRLSQIMTARLQVDIEHLRGLRARLKATAPDQE